MIILVWFLYFLIASFNPVDKIVEILERTNKEKNEEVASLREEIEKLRKGKKEK